MNLTELVDAVQTYVDAQLSVPVQVAGGGGGRPVPSVLIDGWNARDITSQQYVKSRYDENGHETARIYHTPYDADIDFSVRHEDALSASELQSRFKNILKELENNPSRCSEHLARVMTGSASGISYQYANPTESELRQSATFTAAHVYIDEDVQPITDIQFDVQIVE